MTIDHNNLEEFQDAWTYDLEEEGHDEERPLIEQQARLRGGELLDLACGTGRMALRLANQGFAITGVDIAPTMIERARQKAAEQLIELEWIVSDARTFHLQKQFDLIYLIGNAFQAFLTRGDQEALLARVKEHLSPDGRFLFGTRNPSLKNLFEAGQQEQYSYLTPDGSQVRVTGNQSYDPIAQIQHYTTHRQWTHASGQQREKTTRIALRYVFPQEMETLLVYNGFRITSCYGSWDQSPLTETSPRMIYVCQKDA